MNPLAIRAQNLRTFEQLDLDLPTGCVVIGGTNGAGKSTILNAIDVALFCGRGELPGLLSLGEEELHLEVEFEHAGQHYRVRRMFSAKGRGKTTLDLEYFKDAPLHTGDDTGPQWEPLTRETAEQTQQHLEQLLGLSRATFRASAFLAQGDGAAFCDAQPRDRKAILSEVLGLGIYDRLLDIARQELRLAEHTTIALRTKIAALEEEAAAGAQVREELAAANAELTTALERQAVADQALERAQKAHSDNAAANERLLRERAAEAAAKDQQERARLAYAAAVQAAVDRDQRQAQLDDAAGVAEQVPDLEQRLAAAQEQARLVEQCDQLRREAKQRVLAHERLAGEAAGLREHAVTLLGKADHLDAHIDESASCDRCGQTLGAEAAHRAAASFRGEAAEAAAKAVTIEGANATELDEIAELVERIQALETMPATGEPVGHVEQLLTAARTAGERRAALAEQVRQLTEQASEQNDLAIALSTANETVNAAEAATAAALAQVADVGVLEHAVSITRSDSAIAAGQVERQRAAIVRLQVAEQRAQKATDDLAASAAEIEQVAKQVDVLKLAERAFGRDGIPALIVENAAIPQLELEANRILGELGGATADCRVELRTQRLLKTTESLRETLDIVIVTPTGERPYETFSGGERTRLNLALRIALARLLAHRRGAESRLLAIDEPDGLDQAGMQALATVLRGVGGDFDRILLVSHHPDLATEFEQSIVVVKDGDRSRVDVGGGSAGVAVTA